MGGPYCFRPFNEKFLFYSQSFMDKILTFELLLYFAMKISFRELILIFYVNMYGYVFNLVFKIDL